MLDRDGLLRRMASDLAMLPSHLSTIVRTAPLRYKVFEIKKKSGGLREVAQPAREVKAIQRWLVREIGPLLPVHDCATAYRIGSSIIKNAAAHKRSRYILKLDFNNFFPSVVLSDIQVHLERHCAEDLDPEARKLVAHVCCWARLRQTPLRLCIGAPSSPLLSNSILHEFDSRIAVAAKEDDAVYTRYADDITISSRRPGIVERYSDLVRSVLRDLQYPKLEVNDRKTVLASRAGRRTVTGLVLTPDELLSIGRERKRLIRAMYHHSLYASQDEMDCQRLAGLLSFADSVEPGFYARLRSSVKRRS